MEYDPVKLLNTIKQEIADESTFHSGITHLLQLRQQMFDMLLRFKKELKREDFNAMPFIDENGFHNKTIAYSIWHIFRIEDIVAHTLVNKDRQIFFSDDYQRRIASPIITTGNELVRHEIADFSRSLDLDELYLYAEAVKSSTDKIIETLSFDDLEKGMNENDKQRLRDLGVVSQSENAGWLIDYWCGQNIKRLVLMPLSEHWMAHIHASWIIKMTQDINSNIRIIPVVNSPVTETITIRPIEEKDNKGIAALIRSVFEEFDAPKTGSVYNDPQTDRLFQSFYQYHRAGYWVVEYNGNIVGGCGFYPTKGLDSDCAELVKFYLSPLFRGKKVGYALLNMVEEKAKKCGYKQLYIESFPQFRNAVALYERNGFRHLKSQLGNSGHTATTIHMIKDI